MRIKKVINNNIVCGCDEKNREMIVTGKGIGFGKKPNDEIEQDKVRKIYCMTNSSVQRRLIELMEEIPYEHLRLTDEFIDEVKEQLPYNLNENLLLTLSDHISFAISRQKQNMAFSNPLLGAIMQYYPEEFRLGKNCLKKVRERLDVELSIDEAGFIAMHIVNAELNTSMDDMYEITSLIEDCMRIVEDYYGKKFDTQSLAFSRFTVHMRYFAQRLFCNEMHNDRTEERDEVFRNLIMKNCSEHYECAKRISDLVSEKYNKQVTDDELVYLTIHLKRISA